MLSRRTAKCQFEPAIFFCLALCLLIGFKGHVCAQLDLGTEFQIGNEDPALTRPNPSISRLDNGGFAVVYESKYLASGPTVCQLKIADASRNWLRFSMELGLGMSGVSSCSVASDPTNRLMVTWSALNATTSRKMVWVQVVDGVNLERLSPPRVVAGGEADVDHFGPVVAYTGGASSSFAVAHWSRRDVPSMPVFELIVRLHGRDGTFYGASSVATESKLFEDFANRLLLQTIPRGTNGRALLSWSLPHTPSPGGVGAELWSTVIVVSSSGVAILNSPPQLALHIPLSGPYFARRDFRATPLDDGMSAIYAWSEHFNASSPAVSRIRTCIAGGLHLPSASAFTPCPNDGVVVYSVTGDSEPSVSLHAIAPQCNSNRSFVAFSTNTADSRLYFKSLDLALGVPQWSHDYLSESINGPTAVALAGKSMAEDCNDPLSALRPTDEYPIVLFREDPASIYAYRIRQYRSPSEVIRLAPSGVNFQSSESGDLYAPTNAVSASSPNGNIIHVYEDWSHAIRDVQNNLILNILTPGGELVRSAIVLTGRIFYPAIAVSSSNNILVVYQSYAIMNRLEAVIYDAAGNVIKSGFYLAGDASDTFECPSAVWDPSAQRFVVAWRQKSSGWYQLRLISFAADGTLGTSTTSQTVETSLSAFLTPTLVPAFSGVCIFWNAVDIGTSASMIIRATYLRFDSGFYEPDPSILMPSWNPVSTGLFEGPSGSTLGWRRQNLRAARVIEEISGAEHIGLVWEQTPVINVGGDVVGSSVIAGCLLNVSANRNAPCTPVLMNDQFSMAHSNPTVAVVNSLEEVVLVASWLSAISTSHFTYQPTVSRMHFGLLMPNSSHWQPLDVGGEWFGKETYISGVDSASFSLLGSNFSSLQQSPQSSATLAITYRNAFRVLNGGWTEQFSMRNVTIDFGAFSAGTANPPPYAAPAFPPTAPVAPPIAPTPGPGYLTGGYGVTDSRHYESRVPISLQLSTGNLAILMESGDRLVVTLLSGEYGTVIYSENIVMFGTTSSSRPELADGGNGWFLVVWEQTVSGDTSEQSTIWAQLWRATHVLYEVTHLDAVMVSTAQQAPQNVLASATQINDDPSTSPVFLIVWKDFSSSMGPIKGRIVSYSGYGPSRLAIDGQEENLVESSLFAATDPKVVPFPSPSGLLGALVVWRSSELVDQPAYTDGLHARVFYFSVASNSLISSGMLVNLVPNEASTTIKVITGLKVTVGNEVIGISWTSGYPNSGGANGDIRVVAIRPYLGPTLPSLLRATLSTLFAGGRLQRRVSLSHFTYSHEGSDLYPGGITNAPAFLIGWESTTTTIPITRHLVFTDWYPLEEHQGPINDFSVVDPLYPSIVPLAPSIPSARRKDSSAREDYQDFTILHFENAPGGQMALRSNSYNHTKQDFAPSPPSIPVDNGTTPTTATGNVPTSSNSKKGLSSGAIAGIIVGACVAFLLLIAIIAGVLLRDTSSKNHSNVQEMAHLPPRRYIPESPDPEEEHPLPILAPTAAPVMVQTAPPPTQHTTGSPYSHAITPNPAGPGNAPVGGAGHSYEFEPSPYET